MSEMPTRPSGRHLNSCPDQPVPFSIDVLGTLRVVAGARELALSSRRQRALLVLLAMNANEGMTSDRLIDQLWDGTPPPGALVTLRSYISHLRKALDDHVEGHARITTTDSGYRLDIDEENLDAVRFRSAVAAGHRHLRAGESSAALAAFDAALQLWRGQPLAEVAGHEAAAAFTAELVELRAGAVEGRLRALVETGRHVEAISGLEALVSSEALREVPRELLMVALYRSGRSADALDVHRTYRSLLQDQLGIDPSPRLDQLVTAILNRDPRLDPEPGAASTFAPPSASPQSPAELARTLLASLHQVSGQLAAAVAVLSGQVPGGSAELTALADMAAALGVRDSESALGTAIAS